ncbi:MAG: carbohydrate-binding family 9-like protein [Pseudomonadales bacterium]
MRTRSDFWVLVKRLAASIVLLDCAAFATAEVSFVAPVYQVQRTVAPVEIDGKLDEPAWLAAPRFRPLSFTWFKEGEQEQTVVKMLWDDQYLYVAHLCEDAHITARCEEHDGPVAKDDCLEVMIAPDPERPSFYYNLEWNVIGGYVDGHRPDGPKGPRVPWDAEGIEIAGESVGTLNEDTDVDRFWIVEVAIPLKNFGQTPKPKSVWHLNINRHGGDTNIQYSQWSPGDTPQPAFHTPHRFGRIVFSETTSPFEVARESKE